MASISIDMDFGVVLNISVSAILKIPQELQYTQCARTIGLRPNRRNNQDYNSAVEYTSTDIIGKNPGTDHLVNQTSPSS